MFTQLVFHTRGRFPWQADTEDLTAFVRTIGRVAGSAAVLFGFAVEHGHVVVDTPDARALGYLRSKLRRAAPFAGLAADDVYETPVTDRDHLATLASYFGRQPFHHGLPWDSALYLGSTFPDLVGARLLPGFRASAVHAALSHVDVPETMLRSIGLRGPLLPATDVDARELGAVLTWRACRDALAMPANDRLSDIAITTLRTFCALTSRAGFHQKEARDAACISRPAWYRLLALGAPAEAVEAVRMRIALVRLAAATPVSARKVPERTPPPVLRSHRTR